MCGIAGILNLYRERKIEDASLTRMIDMVRHRGPDGFGFYRDARIGLAHARLSIIDLPGGAQPIHNENKTLRIVFNGEIFNYLELRKTLEEKGHVFYTRSDTEVILHLYEEYGTECLSRLNGQFAFAIWDLQQERLFLARDRLGVRPLFYTRVRDTLLFASEIKSLLTDPDVTREIEPCALDQIFTFWMTIPPRTALKDIFELPPGHFITVRHGLFAQKKYWDLDFSQNRRIKTEDEYAEELRELLIDSIRLRLRADVPVGVYLSGGLDSSTIAALVRNHTENHLRTFSVTFDDAAFDESEYQQQMIRRLGCEHSTVFCSPADIADSFPDVVWHTEKPIVRTAPAPLFLLSRLVRKNGYKVVLTGEGSDELLAGYDIFKETKIRRFMERDPDSRMRPLILRRLYPYLQHSPVRALKYAESFFTSGAEMFPAECYSHIPRWKTTSRLKSFFSADLKNALIGYDTVKELMEALSGECKGYDDVSLAQYIEMKTLLSGYLLSSQGDRVAMAHSVEGRFPFLDHRVVEFACCLPPLLKMRALTEKYILKKSMKGMLPDSVMRRPKQPYLAPDAKSFLSGTSPAYVEDILSERSLTQSGYFDPKAVSLLVKKCRSSSVLGFKDNMAVVGIISTQLLHDQFIAGFSRAASHGAA